MKISLEWLGEYVEGIDSITPQELSDKLTLHTCEVEKIESNISNFDDIVVGEIKEIKDHPNADALKICMTDVGGGEVTQIVCGGSNIYEGMKCVVAKLGAKVLWHGTDEMVMEKVKLRGELSMGMICAAEEVGMSDLFKSDNKEVVDLKDYSELKVGDNVSKLFGKERLVFDIDNKSLTHRPDLWGHIGIAREVSAITGAKFHNLQLSEIQSGSKKIKVSVEAKDRCPRFEIIEISGLKICESPDWMKNRLLDCGVRPISNIVDVTNYVMLELGQPMHAYDTSKVVGGFTIRMSKEGDKFKTLDDIERKLSGEEVLVCDDEKILGLGGVMGGQSTEVSDSTTSIYLEAANWTPSYIRMTGTRFGLRSEAVQRYEKGLDPLMTDIALKRAVELLRETCPNLTIDSEITDIQNFENNKNTIVVGLDKTRKIIGLDLSDKEIMSYLESIEFECQRIDDSSIDVSVPTFRSMGDVSIEADVIEEIARLAGYNNIEGKSLDIKSSMSEVSEMNRLERKVRDILKGLGLIEVMTYSLLSKDLVNKMNGNIEDHFNLIKSVSEEFVYLRKSLLPRILEIAEKNKVKTDYSLFEIGHIYNKNENSSEEKHDEKINLSIFISRRKSKKEKKDIFFDLKGLFEVLSDKLTITSKYVKKDSSNNFDTLAEIKVRGKSLGTISTLSDELKDKFSLTGKDIAYLEFSLSDISSFVHSNFKYEALNKFPSVTNGMTLLVPEEITIEVLLQKILSSKNKLLQSVEIRDIYRGGNVSEGMKSIALDFVYQSKDHTLTEQEVDIVHKNILEGLKKLGVEHR